MEMTKMTQISLMMIQSLQTKMMRAQRAFLAQRRNLPALIRKVREVEAIATHLVEWLSTTKKMGLA